MGVWERSPAGLAVANPDLAASWQRVLGEVDPGDVAGSPYCVRRYVVDEHLGGAAGLADARAHLARRGIALLLDFGTLAPDHPGSPDAQYLVTGTPADLAADPASFIRVGETVAALGRDPYFPAWPDVIQLNAFAPALQAARPTPWQPSRRATGFAATWRSWR